MLKDDGRHDGSGGHDDLEIGLGGVSGTGVVTEFDSRGRRAGTFREEDLPDLSLGQDWLGITFRLGTGSYWILYLNYVTYWSDCRCPDPANNLGLSYTAVRFLSALTRNP